MTVVPENIGVSPDVSAAVKSRKPHKKAPSGGIQKGGRPPRIDPGK
ncbi:MAG: hypothetical protein IPJ86_16070 [Bacteroidetes bacterium]|nr:hypothetical protein [Bacteroidota bacterium]